MFIFSLPLSRGEGQRMDDLLIAGSPVAAEAKGEDAAAVAILILLPAIPTRLGHPRAVRPGFLRGEYPKDRISGAV